MLLAGLVTTTRLRHRRRGTEVTERGEGEGKEAVVSASKQKSFFKFWGFTSAKDKLF